MSDFMRIWYRDCDLCPQKYMKDRGARMVIRFSSGKTVRVYLCPFCAASILEEAPDARRIRRRKKRATIRS